MYIPLYNKSYYTLLSSLLRIDDLIQYAKDNDISYIGLADSNMYGVMEFIKKCENEKIHPVIGLDVSVDDFSLVLYAKNYDGYQNLMRISTMMSEKKVILTDLERYSKHLICILPFSYRNQFE